ncbi:PREDICTED: protein N-lysine methyltransferase METTL21A-like [Ipomoea nil]|uniref:protein N-lysine methyltransferase METTL21A-like n=1 Tax=Ipomoea nil TaxID=35883 RepID=UPI0009012F9D|nr:PREDICTED: protein N-lysine methyltransferase METTL21A-like [Ipomoea nil]
MTDQSNNPIDAEDSDEVNPFTMLLPGEEVNNESAPLQHQRYNLQSIDSAISIRQLPSQGLSFQLWPAAATLVNLLDGRYDLHPSLSALLAAGKPLRVLELGSGTGVVGIAAAATLGASVTVTDLPHVLANIQFNIDLNSGVLENHGGAVDVAALSWGEMEDMEAIGREYDLLLGSDVVYYDHLYDPLLKTLRFFLLEGERKTAFVMAHLKRWKKESAFFKKAKKVFDVEIIHSDPPLDGSRIGVAVYLFVAKSIDKRSS